MRNWIDWMVGMVVNITVPGRTKDERGLSQSTETAVLVGGVLVIASAIVIAITAFVNKNLPK